MQTRALLVTGASRGIGLEFVKQLSRLPSPPSYIFAACRNPESATELNKLAKDHDAVRVIKLDVTNDEDISNAVKLVGETVGPEGLNVLINNAGINNKGQRELASQTRNVLLDHYNANVVSPVLLSQQFAPLLKAASVSNSKQSMGCHRAAIVNISTIMACIEENPTRGGFYPYRTSKSALNMATHCLRLELEDSGIAVVALHPGWTKTDMGGPNADVGCSESVSGMIDVLSGLTPEQNGKLYDHTGRQLKW